MLASRINLRTIFKPLCCLQTSLKWNKYNLCDATVRQIKLSNKITAVKSFDFKYSNKQWTWNSVIVQCVHKPISLNKLIFMLLLKLFA